MPLRLAISREYMAPSGRPTWAEAGPDPLAASPDIEVEFLPSLASRGHAALVEGFDALVAATAEWDRESFAGVERLALIARHGVGYDTIDVDAATEAGVMVTITRGAPDRPVAEGALTLMLAIGHHVVLKDRLTRQGRWSERQGWRGVELRDRTIGIIGFGGIGRELCRLLGSFRVARVLALDPYAMPESMRELGAEPASLAELLAESDFVSIHCPLTPETRALIGARELALMKRSAFLVNTARGGIVDQDALAAALAEGAIRGAALDVFREEPLDPNDALTRLDNVILCPHHVAVTDELIRDYYRCIEGQVLALARGEVPEHVVNPAALDSPRLQRKLAELRSRAH
jgi:phosphoglycerate dehydrogenase-like enzyme